MAMVWRAVRYSCPPVAGRFGLCGGTWISNRPIAGRQAISMFYAIAWLSHLDKTPARTVVEATVAIHTQSTKFVFVFLWHWIAWTNSNARQMMTNPEIPMNAKNSSRWWAYWKLARCCSCAWCWKNWPYYMGKKDRVVIYTKYLLSLLDRFYCSFLAGFYIFSLSCFLMYVFL